MTIKVKIKVAILILQALVVGACVTNNSNSPVTTVGPSPSPVNTPVSNANENAKPRSEVTLAVLDALLANDNFVSEVKSKLQITDEQIGQLRKASTDEVNRLRSSNAEDTTVESADARARATEQINRTLGEDKATQFNGFVSEFWARGAGPPCVNLRPNFELGVKRSTVISACCKMLGIRSRVMSADASHDRG